MHIVVFSNGNTKISPLIKDVLKSANFFIAADNGAMTAGKFRIIPDVIIGDFDSLNPKLSEKLQKKGSYLISYPNDKDETDTELALDYAVKKGATDITIIGGNDGDRFDHVIANLFLAASSAIPVKFVNGNQISWVIKGPAEYVILGEKGELLSLIPLKGNVEDITLDGLQYNLTHETLLFGKPRGISNVFTGKTAKVTFAKGVLLLVHSRRS